MDKTRIAVEMIAAGASDQAVADRIGGLHRMAVNRHRRLHVVLPAPALTNAATGASMPRREAAPPALAAIVGQTAPGAVVAMAAAPQDIVNAALGAPRQAEKLVRIEDRLERMATLAEQTGSPGQVATIAAAQLRAVETGAKLAGVGGFAPQKMVAGSDQPVFSINFIFSGQPRQTIECYAPGAQSPVVEARDEQPEEPDMPGVDAGADAMPGPLDLARLVAAFRATPAMRPDPFDDDQDV